MVCQQSQRRLRQSQSSPEKPNLADHRKHTHFFRREVAQHQQCQSDLQRKRYSARQSNNFAGDVHRNIVRHKGKVSSTCGQASARTSGTS